MSSLLLGFGAGVFYVLGVEALQAKRSGLAAVAATISLAAAVAAVAEIAA